MLQTVEAEITVDGQIRLLEPLPVKQTSRVLVTLLENGDNRNRATSQQGNAAELLRFLQENRLPEQARPSVEEIEEQILEARESWD